LTLEMAVIIIMLLCLMLFMMHCEGYNYHAQILRLFVWSSLYVELSFSG